MSRALKGRSILITRQKEKAKSFQEKLMQYDATVYTIPFIKTEKLAHKIPSWQTFSWLIFTSANGVDYFMAEHLQAQEAFPLKIAVVGSKTAEAVEKYGFKVDFMPTVFRGEVFVDEFLQTHNNPGNLLLVRGKQARKEFEHILIKRAYKYSVLEVYDTKPDLSERESLCGLVKEKKLDYITFTSPSTVAAFFQMIEGKSAKHIVAVCIGPTTSDEAKKHRFKHIIVADPYTVEGMIDGLLKYEKSKES